MEPLRKGWEAQATESLCDGGDLEATDRRGSSLLSSVTRQNEELRLSLCWGWRWGGAHGREGDLRAREAQEGVRGVLGSGSGPVVAHSACDPGPQSSSATFKGPEKHHPSAPPCST